MARPLRSSAVLFDRRSEWIELPPRPQLAGVVAAAWAGSAGWPRRLRLLPDGCADLVWNGRELLVAPPRDQAHYGVLEAGDRNVGLRLRCGAAHLVTGDTSGWRSFREAVERRLRRAGEPERGLEILQDLMEERLADAPVDSAVLAAVAHIRAGDSLDMASRTASLEPREMRRRFATAVGLSPKRLQRMVRFERLLHALDSAPDAVLAAELGYADQAHMIRECRAISGSTPRRLARPS